MSFIKSIKDKRKAKKYNLTIEQYLEYLDLSQTEAFTLSEYNTLLKSRELKISFEEFKVFLSHFKYIYSINRYKEYLVAKEFNLTLSQYDEYMRSPYKLKDDIISFIQHDKANQLGLKPIEYDEYINDYKEKISLDRFNELIISRNHSLTLDQYDEWKNKFSTEMEIERFCDLVNARNQGISLERYDYEKAAAVLNISLDDYYKYIPAKEKGVSFEEFPIYIEMTNKLASGSDYYTIKDFQFLELAYKSGYKKIYIDTSVTEIPVRAFENYSEIEEIIIPWGLEKIGEYAFKDCKSLKELIIPGTVNIVPRGIFEGCDNLESIELHSGIRKVDITEWTELPTLKSIFSASSINEFEIDKSQNYLYVNNDSLYDFQYDRLGLTEIQDTVEVLEFGNNLSYLNELLNFPKLHTIILNSNKLENINKIENCPNLKTIIIGGVDTSNYYTKKGTRRKNVEYKKDLSLNNLKGLEDTLKFLIIKDDLIRVFGGIRKNKEDEYEYPYYSKLSWLHSPLGTEYIDIDGPLNYLSVPNKSVINLPENYSRLHFNYSNYNHPAPLLMKDCKFFEKKSDMYVVNGEIIRRIKSSYFNSSFGKREYDLYFPKHHECSELSLFYGVKKIEQKEFESYNMKTLFIPKSVEEIEDEAFLNCDKLEKVVFLGLPKKISKSAFSGCTNLKEIVSQDLLKVRNLSGLTQIDLSNINNAPKMNVKELPKYFFDGSGIEELIIPKTVKVINEKAFANSKKLKRIIFKGKLEKIAKDAFEGCENVEDVVWGDNKIFNIAGKTGFPKIKYLRLPDDITHIEDYSFENWGIHQINFPKNLKSIGHRAFANCKNLTSINGSDDGHFIVNGNFSFEEDSFLGCNSFNSVSFIISHIGTLVNILHQVEPRVVSVLDNISHNDFNKVLEYESVEINCLRTVDSISFEPIYKFNKCSDKIERLELPKCVQYISDDFLSDCIYLEYLTLADKTLIIHDEAFSNCLKIKKIITTHAAYELNNSLKSLQDIIEIRGVEGFNPVDLYLNNNIEEINHMTNIEKALVKKVIVSFDTHKIPGKLFSGFHNLEKIVFEGNLFTIGSSAFKKCFKLRTIQVPNTVIEIGDSAFEECVSLTNFRVPDNLTTLNSSLFKNCSNLKEVNNLLNIGYIKKEVFKNCRSLEKLIFSEEIFSIQNAFEGCTSIKKLVIPVDIAVFKVDLSSCVSLEEIYLPREIDEFSAITDPENKIKAFAKRGSNWKDYFDVYNRKYLKISDYDSILKNELINANLSIQTVKVTKTNTLSKETLAKNVIGNKNITPKETYPIQRATWDTRSREVIIREDEVFEKSHENLDSLLTDLVSKQEILEYVIERVKRLGIESKIDYEIIDINSDIEIISEKTIKNNIFTVKLKNKSNFRANELFIILVDAEGGSMSSMKRVSNIDSNNLNYIQLQLELKSGIANQDYKIVVAKSNPIEKSIVSFSEVSVNIAFSLDFDF